VLRVFKVILALTQLASALRHLHSLGIAHADLKPKNVIRIYNRQSLLDMDNSGVFGTDYFGLKFSSRPSCAARGLGARRGDRAGAGARLSARPGHRRPGRRGVGRRPVNRRRSPFLALETLSLDAWALGVGGTFELSSRATAARQARPRRRPRSRPATTCALPVGGWKRSGDRGRELRALPPETHRGACDFVEGLLQRDPPPSPWVICFCCKCPCNSSSKKGASYVAYKGKCVGP